MLLSIFIAMKRKSTEANRPTKQLKLAAFFSDKIQDVAENESQNRNGAAKLVTPLINL
jgi:hypothetical protein